MLGSEILFYLLQNQNKPRNVFLHKNGLNSDENTVYQAISNILVHFCVKVCYKIEKKEFSFTYSRNY